MLLRRSLFGAVRRRRFPIGTGKLRLKIAARPALAPIRFTNSSLWANLRGRMQTVRETNVAEPGIVAMPLTVTAFSKDDAGRFVYNTIEEAKTGPVDVLVVGGGSFGGILASELFALETAGMLGPQPPSPIADQAGNQANARGEPAHAPHRIVVLEAGPHGLSEHIQNLPAGLNLGIPNFPDELISPASNT